MSFPTNHGGALMTGKSTNKQMVLRFENLKNEINPVVNIIFLIFWIYFGYKAFVTEGAWVWRVLWGWGVL